MGNADVSPERAEVKEVVGEGRGRRSLASMSR